MIPSFFKGMGAFGCLTCFSNNEHVNASCFCIRIERSLWPCTPAELGMLSGLTSPRNVLEVPQGHTVFFGLVTRRCSLDCTRLHLICANSQPSPKKDALPSTDHVQEKCKMVTCFSTRFSLLSVDCLHSLCSLHTMQECGTDCQTLKHHN